MLAPLSPRLIYSALLLALSIWLSALWAAPWAWLQGHEWLAVFLYRGFALVCHQRPERSFHWHGLPLAVCVRCTGLYVGVWLGLWLCLIWPRWSRRSVLVQRAFLVALAALAFDWALGALGWVTQNVSTRLLTGLAVGVSAVFYLSSYVYFREDKRMN